MDVVVASVVLVVAAVVGSVVRIAAAAEPPVASTGRVAFAPTPPILVAVGRVKAKVAFPATTSGSMGIVVTCSTGVVCFVLIMSEVIFTQYIGLVSTMVALQEINDNGKRRISGNKTASLSWPTVIVQSLFYNIIYRLNYS